MIVEETLTDVNGEFRFGKWGPKLRPYYGVLDTAPWLVIFKSGYEHRFLPNEHDSNGFLRRSDWNGQTLALPRFAGSAAQRLSVLTLVLSLSELQPHMLREILSEQESHSSWPGEGPAFFRHVKDIVQRGGNDSR